MPYNKRGVKWVNNERLKNLRLNESSKSYSVLWFSNEVVINETNLITKFRTTLIAIITAAMYIIAGFNTLSNTLVFPSGFPLVWYF